MRAELHLLPGVVDDQVHFREPGLTHKEDLAAASRACAKGGVTTFLEMPNTKPSATTQQLVDDKYALAAKKSLVNYGFYIGATPNNIEDLRTARNVPGIKIFIGSSTGDLLVDDQEALGTHLCRDDAADHGSLRRRVDRPRECRAACRARRTSPIIHGFAITKPRWSPLAEPSTLAKRHNHRFHLLHVSTGARDGAARRSPRALLPPKSCPHHLLFNVDDYARLGTLLQANPSVNDEARQRATVASTNRQQDPGLCHRTTRRTPGRGKTAILPTIAIGDAVDRKQLGVDAQRSASQPFDLAACGPRRCAMRRRASWDIVGKRPHRGGLRRRSRAG